MSQFWSFAGTERYILLQRRELGHFRLLLWTGDETLDYYGPLKMAQSAWVDRHVPRKGETRAVRY